MTSLLVLTEDVHVLLYNCSCVLSLFLLLDMLLTLPVSSTNECLPSPNQLKMKIIVKVSLLVVNYSGTSLNSTTQYNIVYSTVYAVQ